MNQVNMQANCKYTWLERRCFVCKLLAGTNHQFEVEGIISAAKCLWNLVVAYAFLPQRHQVTKETQSNL